MAKKQTPAKGSTRNFYLTPGIDYSKLKDDAIRLMKGDERNPATRVVIHHHKYGEPCNGQRNHDIFDPKEKRS
jgi:hypothetical protein